MKRFVKTCAHALGIDGLSLYKWMQLVGAWCVCGATAPRLLAAEDTPAAPSMGNALVAELVVVALIAACGWLAVLMLRRRRFALHGAGEPVRVVGGVTLGAREKVVVLSVRGRQFLVGATAHQISLIAELGAQAQADAALPEPSAATAPLRSGAGESA